MALPFCRTVVVKIAPRVLVCGDDRITWDHPHAAGPRPLLVYSGLEHNRDTKMVAVESQMLPLGTVAPGFSLPDPDGQTHSLEDSASAYLVMFICNHCPFVIHVREELARIGRDYGARGVCIVAINSNDTDKYPADDLPHMKAEAAANGYAFPYVLDESQEVAKAYRAACTPDFFVFDSGKRLVYRGQLDDSRPSNGLPVDGRDLRAALDAALDSKQPLANQKPSIGCNIKWRPGNEPEYF